MKQHLGCQSGVQNVEVSLLDGKVDITPKEDRRVDPAQLLRATYDSGVRVVEMDVTACGKIVRSASGSLALEAAPSQSFTIERDDLSKGLEVLADASAVATVRGQLYKKPPGKRKAEPVAPLKLLILEVQKKE